MSSNGSWQGFSSFQVFGDHVPTGGVFQVVNIAADPERLSAALETRASGSAPLDPQLAQAVLRAGLGLMQSGSVSFVYANTEGVTALIKSEAVAEAGKSMEVHDHLVSIFAARVALLAGRELPVAARAYEFPDLGVVRQAFVSALDTLEESTMTRCANRIGAQMRGRGEPFHPSMTESLEEQMHLLEDKGVDMESLPPWWWRGVAARASDAGVEVFDELPAGDDFGTLVPG
jgi:hypothetical protein